MIIYKALNKCIVYKALNKCKSFIVLNVKKEILKYESLYNRLEKEFDTFILIFHQIWDLYFDEISDELKSKTKDVTNNNVHFLKFIEYFKNNYLKNYKNWNYYNNIVHITNKEKKNEINILIEKYRTMKSKLIDNVRLGNDIVEL
ncbi:hypothetical protein U3516DRAFT_738834 [Neocallimastix sp. 'constans']